MNRTILAGLLLFVSLPLFAQEGYEIQVYKAELVEKGKTIFELHTNYTNDGSTETIDGVLPTDNVVHATLEITHGFADWFELGFYFFNSIGSNGRTAYVGSHIRPRVSVPERLNWPVGLSLSAEVGFAKSEFSEDEWVTEIRPIVDKKFGKFYLSLNPVVERALKGEGTSDGFHFSPNALANFELCKLFSPGLEYYGSFGPISDPYSPSQQQHQLFIASEFHFAPEWEFIAGYGFGLNDVTDNQVVKVIVGRTF
jgi:hypothetical protein